MVRLRVPQYGQTNARTSFEWVGDGVEPRFALQGVRFADKVDIESAAVSVRVADTLTDTAVQIMNLFGRGDSPSLDHALNAVNALGVAATAVFAAIDASCDIDQPPTRLITRPRGPDRRLITRCEHDPPHCWEGTVYVDCPSP